MVKHNKGILIILDGLGDRGIPAFGGGSTDQRAG
jgi:2,3-bisphosphoglycerate-independent phosphoglycerate mutase